MNILLLGLGRMLIVLSAKAMLAPDVERRLEMMVTVPASPGMASGKGCQNWPLLLLQATPEPARRAQVPDPSSLDSAEQRIREEFNEEYALRTPLEKVGFANLLLSRASQNRDPVSIRYVLLREAMTIASGAGDLATSMWAIDRMTDGFEVDVAPLRERILSAAASVAAEPEDFWNLSRGYLTMADEAIAAAQLDAADKAAREALAFAGRAKSLVLVTRANARAKEVSGLRVAFGNGVREALETLASHPKDETANLHAGLYECFVNNRWEAGLGMLARGSDPAIKQLAARDLANPAD